MFRIIAVASLLVSIARAGLIAAPGLLSQSLIPSASYSQSSHSYSGYSEPSYESYAPKPYSFGYDVTDEYGTKLTRNERSDGYGAVTGSYSYADKHGIYRTVEYIADKLGFRANVKTNEPGTEKSEPASVVIDSNPIVLAYAGPVYRPRQSYQPSYEPSYQSIYPSSRYEK